MMVRSQISLPAEEQRRARARANELGISLAEYVRRLVRADLGETSRAENVRSAFDLGDSGESDVARHKDAYLGDAVGERAEPRGTAGA